jgi:GDPmannose 4,6-dehydratase
MKNKKALITGITGQDGSYLSELLLAKGYEVHGIIRRSSTLNTGRIDSIFDPESKQFLHYGDLSDGIDNLIYHIKPDEIYNLAAMSHVRISFDSPIYTGDITGLGTTRILEGIRKGIENGILSPDIKYYQASSSEMYGETPPPQNEQTPFNPVSPYGCAKLYSYHMTKSYRKGYNIFASNGILFNHESPRRGVRFVTRKITRAACRIKLGIQDKLVLGNLNALRDWGFSGDYVEAIWMILQHNTPDDFVVSTGEYHTVKDFAVKVFNYLDLDFDEFVKHDSSLERPNEVPALLGDSSKIRKLTGWKPKVNFEQLVKMMVDSDMEYESFVSNQPKQYIYFESPANIK